RELLCKANDYGLLDTENGQRFNLLIEGLQQGGRRLRMQHGARMRIESDHGGHSTDCAGALRHCGHDQLMTQMQAIKDTERQDCRALNLGVVSAMKKPHWNLLRSLANSHIRLSI